MSSVKLRNAVSEIVHREAPQAGASVTGILDEFQDELDAYAELILAPAGSAVGFMTRGEGQGFTRRVANVLRQIDMPPAAREHHGFLAELFEHKRAFFKVEWHVLPDGRVEPMAACYFRRRPELDVVLDAYRSREIGSSELHDRLRVMAYTLDKRTVHFVAAAFRIGSPVSHKLYFSQYVAPHTRESVAARIERVLERAGMTPGLRELWSRVHRRALGQTLGLAPGRALETTVFVSVNLLGNAQDTWMRPWIKLDYPDVSPELVTDWSPADHRDQALGDVAWACAAMGRQKLSYLGVRLVAGQEYPVLKYYADAPERSLAE